MSSPTSPTTQAEASRSQWHSLVFNSDLTGIRNKIDGAEAHERTQLVNEGLLYSASFGTIPTTKLFLELGADIGCCDDRQRTPLLRSIELNGDQTVAALLIDHRSDLVNKSEYGGRTPLMQCIWMNRMDVFKALMKVALIKVGLTDKRERNALHHLVRDLDRIPGDEKRRAKFDKKNPSTAYILTELMKADGDIVNKEDEHGRTGLHWTALHGSHSLVELLLAEPKLKADALFQIDQQGRSPLHIAAAKGHFDVLSSMLEKLKTTHKTAGKLPRINEKSTGDWTILNLVLRSSEPPLKLVKDLVKHGADVNICVQDGKNALHLAALTGDVDLVRFMLEQDSIQRSRRDEFGDTPFLCAARGQHKVVPELLKLFAPWSKLFRPEPSSDADTAARSTLLRPVIYEFDGEQATWRELFVSDQLTVHDIIYATNPDNPLEPALKTVSDSKSFKWIHLPANSITWCLDLVTKHYIEHCQEGDVHGLQELERSFAHHERRNRNPHFSYMTPICGTISKTETDITIPDAHQYFSGDLVPGRISLSSREPWNPAGPAAISQGRSRLSAWKQLMKPSKAQRLEDAQLSSLLPKDSAPAQRGEPDAQGAGRTPERDAITSSSMYLFMPYIHYEITEDQKEMFTLAKQICWERDNPHLRKQHGSWKSVDSQQGGNAKKNPSKNRKAMNEALLRSHFADTNPNTLHLRRTLDQYYYQAIDTRKRDEDQAGQRAQKKRHTKQPENDQGIHHCCLEKEYQCNDLQKTLTLHERFWTLLRLIISMITMRPITDFKQKLRLLFSSYEHDKRIPAKQVCAKCNSVDTCARDDLVITSFPAAWGAPSKQSDMLRRIVDFIRSNNNDRVDSVHELAQLIIGQFYESYRRLANDEKHEFLRTYMDALGDIKEKEIKMLKDFDRNPPATAAHVAKLKDVTAEMELLEEVKDIADELGILDMVLAAQEHVRSQMNDAVVAWNKNAKEEKKQRAYKMCMEHQRAIHIPREEVSSMLVQSAQIEHSIYALLDLKQKHANSLQAYSTLRSGITLMIFTVVTIVFLPLTFISSFFTIEISEFPRDDNGVNLPASFVMTYVFGIGAPVAAALLIIALNAEVTAEAARKFMQRLKTEVKTVSSENEKSTQLRPTPGANDQEEVKLTTRTQSMFIKRTPSYDLEASRKSGLASGTVRSSTIDHLANGNASFP